MSGMQALRRPVKTEIGLWPFMLWCYQRQQVVAETGRVLDGLQEAAGGPRNGFSRDGVAAALEIARLGCHVDGGPGGPEASRCHIDAELLHACVLSLPYRLARVLIDAAEMGEQPEPCAVIPCWRRVGGHRVGGANVACGSWAAVPVPDDLPANRYPVFYRGRRCLRDNDGFHFEVLGETALVWSPYSAVEEYPITTAYKDLIDAIAATFEEAMEALRCTVDGMEFQEHTVLRSWRGFGSGHPGN
jgi:hypothetical protein